MVEAAVYQEAEVDERKEQLRHHAIVLREYAKWRLLRGYTFPPSREAHRVDLVQQFFKLGEQVQLTERDMVLLLFKRLLSPAA